MKKEIKRCAIYIRVSTAMQKMEGWSLDAQRASLTKTAQGLGWKVVGVYADEGKSARKRLKDRREIFHLLDDVQAGKIDVIIFKELDRWFRNVSDFYKVQDILDANGVTWYSERQPNLDMTTKEGRLNVNILLSVGQNEADATSDRIKYTNKYLRQQHRWTSGASNLPRGYTLDEDKHVIIDKDQEPFVRDLIANVLETQSLRRALLITNQAHVQSYIYNNAMNMLTNPMLYGAYKEVEDFVKEPYLSREEFDRLQASIKRQAKTGANRTYIFSGLLTCACCGKSLAGNTAKKTVKTYRCNRYDHQNNLDGHPFVSIAEGKLEALMFEYVREAIADTIVKVESVEQARKPAKPKSNRDQIERKLDKLEDLYINSDRMTKEKYEAKRAAILAQLIEEEPEPQTTADLGSLKQIQALLDQGVDEVYQGMTELERRNFWRGIIHDVTLGPKGEIENLNFIA